MNEKEDNNLKQFRIVIVGFFFIICILTILGKAVYLQVFCYADLSKKAAREYEKSITSKGKRGGIYDARLREVAVSVDTNSVAARPDKIENAKITSKILGKTLNIDSKMLREKFESKKPFIWVKRKVAPAEVKTIRNLHLNGISFVSEHNRVYPNINLAGQVIGFTGVDGQGLGGVEYSFNSYLKEDSGEYTVLKDALGRGFEVEKTTAPNYSGKNVILTIDAAIQYIVENAMETAVQETMSKSGMAVVMVPKTGAVLAMVNVPLFNPNSYETVNPFIRRNRVITDPFEPGSTMKIFSAAAALESGKFNADTKFFCEKGKYKVGEHTIRDVHAYGWLTLHEIVKFSSNIGASKVSEGIGHESLYYTLRKFGFGEKTAIDCPGETNGRLAYYTNWSKIDLNVIAFGQGVSATALQLVTAASAIANDGVLMKPYIIQAITDENGNPIQTFHPQKVRRAISSPTAAVLKEMMKSVTETKGTGVNAAISGYMVCGKTGTAQKADKRNGGYLEGKYTSSFIGFVPKDQPEIAILIVLDEPVNGYYGGQVAAPVFQKIGREILTYLNIPPEIKTEILTVSREKDING